MKKDMAVTGVRDRLRRGLGHRYRVEEELGRGGMATVYGAIDLKHGRQVAIKVMRPDLAARGYEPERFLREIGIAARLTHPQILPVYDSGECDGLLYYVMPVMGGETLRGRLLREQQLPVEETLRLARAVAAGLDYAHRQNILHRDIKPENILLHEGEAVLADFGVARAISLAGKDHVAGTDPGLAIGTPEYMSPEQASAERDLDGRSDQYSLACVVFEMLAGRPPFWGVGARAVMAQHVVEPPPSVRDFRPAVSPSIDHALCKALAKDPKDRFATAAQFAEALFSMGPVPPSEPRGERAIAVLPFVNGTADPENEYISDGLTDELINALTKVRRLEVASRTSVFALKGKPLDVRTIGAQLGVHAVLEGTVRKAGQRLRITVQLTDTVGGRSLWSERYDREFEDIFAIQEEIAQTIVSTLRTHFLGPIGDPTPKRYTDNVKAYGAYLKGRYAWNKRTHEGISEAIEHFEEAIAEDPQYALAYSGLADSYALQVDYRDVPVAEGVLRAKQEALHALQLDEGLAEAHTSLGWVRFLYDWDWAAAERSFRRAIELNPHYATARQWYSWLLMVLGRTGESLVEGRTAADLDPSSVSIRRSLGWLYYYARRYESALEHLERATVMNPTQQDTHFIQGLVHTEMRHYDLARAALERALAADGEPNASLAALGCVEARSGHRDKAEEILARLEAAARERYVSPTNFGALTIAMGMHDAAFGWLEQVHRERRGWLAYLRVDPRMDPIRGDPRFTQWLRRMNLD